MKTNLLNVDLKLSFCPRCRKRSDAPTKTQNYKGLCNTCCARYLRMKKHPFKKQIIKTCEQQLLEIKSEKEHIEKERNGYDSV